MGGEAEGKIYGIQYDNNIEPFVKLRIIINSNGSK